jgi:hypothetical protein
LWLLKGIRDSPPGQKDQRYESYGTYSTAFSSLTKREFHASDPEKAGRDRAAAFQSEKNFAQG